MFSTIICPDTNEKVYTYDDYLNTLHWKKFRQSYIEFNGEICEYCSEKGEELHHLHYDSLGCEQFCDVQLLCKNCHKEEHPPETD